MCDNVVDVVEVGYVPTAPRKPLRQSLLDVVALVDAKRG